MSHHDGSVLSITVSFPHDVNAVYQDDAHAGTVTSGITLHDAFITHVDVTFTLKLLAGIVKAQDCAVRSVIHTCAVNHELDAFISVIQK